MPPDATGLRRPYARFELRLFDLLRGPRHTLVLYSNRSDPADDCAQFAQIDRALREQYGETIQTVAVLHADCERTVYEGLAVVVDARGEFAQRYGAEQNACYLIRPDGYLAYRARKADAERISGRVDRVLR